jgi:integrating conjugative element protein (TIGR03746 family)
MVSGEVFMKFQNVLENYKLALLIAIGALGLFFLCNVGLMWSLHASQKDIRVFIPPNIPMSGVTMQAGEVPNESVFSFAYYIWQNVNDWSSNGAEDYKNNLTKYAPFLTPRFHAQLESDFIKRYQDGEVQERLRSLEGTNGSVYTPTDVEYVGHGTWIVHLTMHLTEHVKDTDATVKDVEMNYTMRVVHYDVSTVNNPWGLALDGFEAEPARITTTV